MDGIIQEVKGNALGSGGMPFLQASATTFGANHERQERARMGRWGRGRRQGGGCLVAVGPERPVWAEQGQAWGE